MIFSLIQNGTKLISSIEDGRNVGLVYNFGVDIDYNDVLIYCYHCKIYFTVITKLNNIKYLSKTIYLT